MILAHHFTVRWSTKCPECPRVLHEGESMFVTEDAMYCENCYDAKKRATAPKADLDIYMIDGHRVTYHPNPAAPNSPWISIDDGHRYSYLDVKNAYSVIYAPNGRR